MRTSTHNSTENQPDTDNEVQEESRTNSEVEESSHEARNPQSHFCYRLWGTDCHLDQFQMTMMREMRGQFELDVWLQELQGRSTDKNLEQQTREKGLGTAKDMLAHVQYKYRAIGRIYASALIQGAGIPPLLSHQMVQYGQGYRESTIETVDIVGNPNRKKMHIFGFVGIFEYIC